MLLIGKPIDGRLEYFSLPFDLVDSLVDALELLVCQVFALDGFESKGNSQVFLN